MYNFYDDDGTNNKLLLFTKLEPVIEKFSAEDDESTFSVPCSELDEWRFQHHRHDLRTWLMVDSYIEIDENDNEKVIHAVVKVSKHLFYGKAPSAIVSAMADAGHPRDVIAYVLYHALIKPVTKSKIGVLLHEKKGLYQQTYIIHAKKLLADAAKLNIQIVD